MKVIFFQLKSFKRIFYALILPILNSCTSIVQSPKYQLTDGFYNSSFISKYGNKVFIETHEDTIAAYRARKVKNEIKVDTSNPIQSFPESSVLIPEKAFTLFKPSLDLDFLTIPIKYRPVSEGFPRTLNSLISGNLYLGGRYDIFQVIYRSTPLSVKERKINHYGISIGAFTGIGSAFIAPWFTNNAISSEYDGVVFMKGLALIFDFNQFNAGVSLGADNLLDQNDDVWIFENKPWIGVVLGLNLN